MSTFTPITLNGTVTSTSGQLAYGETDGTGMQLQMQTYDLLISVNPQSTGDGSSRKANEYNGIDVSEGMWISDAAGGTILRIKSISSKSAGIVELVAEDVDMLSFRLNNINSLSAGGSIVVFSNNPEGEAVITNTSGFEAGGLDKIQSRFLVNEADDRVKFTHSVAPSVEAGDIVTVDNNGNLVKYGTIGGSSIKVGTVLNTIRNGKDVFVKPFNDISRNYKNPEALTGTPGSVYYTDTNTAGNITTIAGGKASYLQLNTKIASTKVMSSNVPTSSDIILINGVEVYSGSEIANIEAWKNLINGFTASTNVVATATATPVSVQGGDIEPNYAPNDYWSGGDSYIAVGPVGGTQDIGQVAISDGITSALISFNNPDDTINVGGQEYNIITPTAQLVKFNDAISQNGLNISAELIDMVAYDGQAVKLTTNGAATQIVLGNVNPAAFGNNVVGTASWTGIGMTATVGSPVLTLTRNAGGPIEITGSPISSGWINSNGAVSSNSGRVPYLLLIESDGSGSGSSESGVLTSADLNNSPSITSSDGDSTGITITYTPFSDSSVTIKVNGMEINLSNGNKNEDAYFSADGGTTSRLIADITAGDTLYWNGTNAGYQLDGTDDLDISYQKSSLD
tara:strand:+ start:294 stop:2171 length:1878 start_codon:yes stop_codon:yes gene_type:complete